MPQTQGNGFVTSNALPLVQLDGVDIVNEDNLILSDVSFKVSRGDLVYLVGKVGSGKSSILKTLNAELPVAKGKARVGDYDLSTIKKSQIPFLRRNLGVVFQDFQLLTDRTVEDNLMFVLKATGWNDERKMRERCTQVLDMVGLETKAHKMPHQLSGGEQQRVAIARALLNNPDVILADEPTGNLDAETADGIMALMMKIHHQYKPAIIIVTHNRTIIDRYPGRVLLCKDGICREVTEEVNLAQSSELKDDMPD
ncbi:MAG: ATP-binding cassette domain-containing protein [Bacteroidales bacterium]|nr:ATP-binding cassette domain-containing protein [Bacteroidales bacterium]